MDGQTDKASYRVACSRLKTSFLVFYDLGKKMNLTSGSHIVVKCKPIFKNHVRHGSAKQFPTIWDFVRLCSCICLEVTIKNVNSVLSRNTGNESKNKFDPNKDASNICENERIFLNLLELLRFP